MRGRWMAAAAVAWSVSCAGGNPPNAILGPQVTRPHSECASERARATADTQVARTLHPAPTSLVLPPRDLGTDLRGRSVTVHLLVNEWGEVVRDSIEPPDVPDAPQFRFDLRHYQFRPAVLDGCAVPAWWMVRFTF